LITMGIKKIFKYLILTYNDDYKKKSNTGLLHIIMALKMFWKNIKYPPEIVRFLLVLSWNPLILWSFWNTKTDGCLNLIFFQIPRTDGSLLQNFQIPRINGHHKNQIPTPPHLFELWTWHERLSH
jgi:hypothetical protein